MPISQPARTDAAILEIAGRQHGVIARRQLLEEGLSAREIQYRLETRRLRAVHRGVYRVGPPGGTLQPEAAALLACGDGSRLSHWSGAVRWEILPAQQARPVSVSTLRDVRPGDPRIRVFRVSRLDADEVTVKDGLPITTPARTLLDLAGCPDVGDIERALLRAVPRLTAPEQVRVLLDRYPRRRGRRQLIALLDTAHPSITRSEAERLFLQLVRSGGLPPPETNVVVCDREVDCLWRGQQLVVEVDGRAYHSDAATFEADRGRDTALVAAGYRVIRVTWRQIAKHPRPFLVRLAMALAHGDRASPRSAGSGSIPQ